MTVSFFFCFAAQVAQADRMTKIRPDLRRRANRFSEEVFPALRSTGSGGSGGGGGGSGARRRQQAASSIVPGSGGSVAGEGWGDGEGLVGAGLGDVQLAWDFVTASEESQLGVLSAMRETSRAWLDAALSAQWAAPTLPVPVPPPRRRLRDVAAVESEGDADADSENERGQGGGDGGNGGKTSPARSGSRKGRGNGDGNGDGGREHRRRTTSDDGQLPPAVPLYRVVKVEQAADYSSRGDGTNDDSEHHPAIVRTVWGRMRVPAFVAASARGTGLLGGWETADENSGIGGGRGASSAAGGAQQSSKSRKSQATLEAGFVVRIPRCVAAGEKKPAAVVQYGHGLFGDRSEVEDGFLDVMAERGAWVLVAADWRGMSRVDLTVVARALVSRPELLLSGTAEDLMQVHYAREREEHFFFLVFFLWLGGMGGVCRHSKDGLLAATGDVQKHFVFFFFPVLLWSLVVRSSSDSSPLHPIRSYFHLQVCFTLLSFPPSMC